MSGIHYVDRPIVWEMVCPIFVIAYIIRENKIFDILNKSVPVLITFCCVIGLSSKKMFFLSTRNRKIEKPIFYIWITIVKP